MVNNSQYGHEKYFLQKKKKTTLSFSTINNKFMGFEIKFLFFSLNEKLYAIIYQKV